MSLTKIVGYAASYVAPPIVAALLTSEPLACLLTALFCWLAPYLEAIPGATRTVRAVVNGKPGKACLHYDICGTCGSTNTLYQHEKVHYCIVCSHYTSHLVEAETVEKEY